MAKQVLKNCGVFLGDTEIGTDQNSISLENSADTPEKSAFGDDTHIMAAGGMFVVAMGGAGYFNPDNADAALFATMGLDNTLITATPNRDQIGGVAYFFDAVTGQYNFGGQMGDMFPFTFGAVAARRRLFRGQTLWKGSAGVGSAAGQAVLMTPAPVIGQNFYAGLHVYAAEGTAPSLEVAIESDDNAGFATPSLRQSFPAQNGRGAVSPSPVPVVSSDEYWRIEYSISGAGANFGFMVALAFSS